MCAPTADRRLLQRGWALLLALGLTWVPGQAQTLGDLIEQAKSRRQQQVLQGAPVKPATDPKARTPGAPAPPLLWSLTGLEDRFEAVLIYRARAYTVASDEPSPRRIGPWAVTAVQPSGVTLTLPQQPRSPPLVLAPVPVGASAFPYQSSLPSLGSWADSPSADPLPPALRNVLTDIATPPKPSNLVLPNVLSPKGGDAAPQ